MENNTTKRTRDDIDDDIEITQSIIERLEADYLALPDREGEEAQRIKDRCHRLETDLEDYYVELRHTY